MPLIDALERERVLYLRVPEPVSLDDAATRLAEDLLSLCADVEERDQPPLALALASGGPAFWLAPPRDARDCDAAGPSWARATAALSRLSVPTVAAIGADAIGPAWELALACDLRLLAAEARVGSPDVRFGRIPAAGGTQRLARLAGQPTALRLLLLGEVVKAADALALGLVQRVAPVVELEACLETLLADLRASAPIALAYAKETVHGASELPLAEGLRLEADLAALLHTTHDRAEGIGAFLARRTPRFEGR